MNLDTFDLGGRVLLAIAAGGVANFLLGALWYMALFQKPWLAATGRTAEDFKGGSPGGEMLVTLIGNVVTTAVLAIVYQWGGGTSVLDGVVVGALLGLGLAAMEALKPAVYNLDERVKPWSLYVVNASYAACGLVLAGLVYSLIA